MNTTTEEKNKVLAELLEWPSDDERTFYISDGPMPVLQPFGQYEAGNSFKLEELQFHASYEWIMKVVEKIGSMGHRIMFKTDEGQHYCEIWCYLDGVFENEIACKEDDSGTLISAIYEACVDFAGWHKIYQNSHS